MRDFGPAFGQAGLAYRFPISVPNVIQIVALATLLLKVLEHLVILPKWRLLLDVCGVKPVAE